MDHDISLDVRGLLCPMPVMRTSIKMRELKPGQVLRVAATDIGIKEDMPAWCKATGNEFLGVEEEGDEVCVYLRKTRD